MSKNKKLIFFVLAVMALTLAVRLIPHAPNFTPIGALALFAGAYLPKRWGFIVPLLVMGVADIFVGFYNIKLMAAVYLSLVIMTLFGYLSRKKLSSWRLGLGAAGGSIVFFLVTNGAVWALSSWYPANIGGLFSAYSMGLPFFRMTILSNLLYTTVLFGAYEVVKSGVLERAISNIKRVAPNLVFKRR